MILSDTKEGRMRSGVSRKMCAVAFTARLI